MLSATTCTINDRKGNGFNVKGVYCKLQTKYAKPIIPFKQYLIILPFQASIDNILGSPQFINVPNLWTVQTIKYQTLATGLLAGNHKDLKLTVGIKL